MALSTEGGVTHTSGTFLDFAYDMLEYTIPNYGLVLVKPFDYERETKKVFREAFGDAVILSRERHAQNFNQRLSFVYEMSPEEILGFAIDHRSQIFQGQMPLMEIIGYCAFLLDMALICIEIEDLHLLYTIIEDIEDVFVEHIESFFTIVGGWNSLFKMAEQYQKFATSKLESKPTAIDAKEYFDFLDVDL